MRRFKEEEEAKEEQEFWDSNLDKASRKAKDLNFSSASEAESEEKNVDQSGSGSSEEDFYKKNEESDSEREFY